MYIKCRKNLQSCCDRRKYCYFDYKQNGNKKGKLELLLSVKQAATSGSQETQLPSTIPCRRWKGICNAKKSSQEYQLSCVSRVFHNCPTHLTSALFTRFPFVFRVSSLPVALSPLHYLSQNYCRCFCCCCWWCRRCHCSFLFSAAVVAISLLCRIVWHLLSSAYLGRQQAAKKQLRCFN